MLYIIYILKKKEGKREWGRHVGKGEREWWLFSTGRGASGGKERACTNAGVSVSKKQEKKKKRQKTDEWWCVDGWLVGWFLFLSFFLSFFLLPCFCGEETTLLLPFHHLSLSKTHSILSLSLSLCI